MNYNFVCPGCKQSSAIEEIVVNTFAYSTVEHIDPETGDMDYGSITLDDGEVDRYQCVKCSETIVDEDNNTIDDSVDLVNWLKDNGMLSEPPKEHY